MIHFVYSSIVSDAADPNILIGPMQKVRLYQQLGAKKVKVSVHSNCTMIMKQLFCPV